MSRYKNVWSEPYPAVINVETGEIIHLDEMIVQESLTAIEEGQTRPVQGVIDDLKQMGSDR